MPHLKLCLVAVVLCLPMAVGVSGCGTDSGSSAAPKSCTEAASDGVRECIGLLNDAWATCYADSDVPCASDDENIGDALSQLQTDIERSCTRFQTGPRSGCLIAIRTCSSAKG